MLFCLHRKIYFNRCVSFILAGVNGDFDDGSARVAFCLGTHNLVVFFCFICPVLEESITFVTVDEVGEVEEDVTTETRGRAEKRTRPTAGNTRTCFIQSCHQVKFSCTKSVSFTTVRKSNRGKKVSEKEPADEPRTASPDASSSLDPSTLSSDVQKKKKKEEEEAAGQAENQTLEECVEDRRSIKGTRNKGATEVVCF